MSKILKFFEKLLFPPNIKCVVCGDDLSYDAKYCICDKCTKTLPYITGKSCNKCGAEIHDMGKVCMNCKNAGHVFNKNFCVFKYEYPMDKLIKDFKFRNHKYLAHTLGNMIATKVIESGKTFDLVVPVPMHENRLKARGFNHADKLCDTLRSLNYNVRNDVLIKHIDTTTQASLVRANRIDNLKDSFKVADRKCVKGKVVLIVDDVMTTGATVDECAEVLLKAGATKVYSVTLCRA